MKDEQYISDKELAFTKKDAKKITESLRPVLEEMANRIDAEGLAEYLRIHGYRE